MRKKDSLDSIFKSHAEVFSQNPSTFGRGQSITIWMPDGYKQKYDQLQESTRRGFSKLVREVIKTAIDKAESIDQSQTG